MYLLTPGQALFFLIVFGIWVAIIGIIALFGKKK